MNNFDDFNKKFDNFGKGFDKKQKTFWKSFWIISTFSILFSVGAIAGLIWLIYILLGHFKIL